jgi:hypothetical protein
MAASNTKNTSNRRMRIMDRAEYASKPKPLTFGPDELVKTCRRGHVRDELRLSDGH